MFRVAVQSAWLHYRSNRRTSHHHSGGVRQTLLSLPAQTEAELALAGRLRPEAGAAQGLPQLVAELDCQSFGALARDTASLRLKRASCNTPAVIRSDTKVMAIPSSNRTDSKRMVLFAVIQEVLR